MATSHSPLTSSLSKARGLGSAKEGVGHWWWQRVTAVLIAPLIVWFLYSFLTMMVGATRDAVALWFTSPMNSIGLAVLMGAMFFHAKLGLQVVIEDYVHGHGKKIFMLFLLNILAFVLTAMSWMAIVKLHLMGV